MAHVRPFLVLVVILLVSGGCTSPYDSAIHPHELIPRDHLKRFRPVDLDGDGRDEFVGQGQAPNGRRNSVLIRSLKGRAVAQVHFGGLVLGVHFHDCTQNGRLEIIVPVKNGGSVFYHILSADGRRLHRMHVLDASEQAMRKEAGSWDVRGADIRLADVTGNGKQELISFFKTGFSQQPRGVWVHSYPEGAALGHLRIGALQTGNSYFGDADRDGRHEWIFGSIATNNGATGAGMTDDRAYVAAIEVDDSLHVQWARDVGDTFSRANVRHGDVDGENRLEFFALRTPRSGRQQASPLKRIDPTTGAVQEEYVPTDILQEVRIGDVDRDPQEEIVTLTETGTVRVLDAEMNTQRHRTFDVQIRHLQIVPDLNADGLDELLLWTQRGTLWLGGDLSTVAATPQKGKYSVVQTGKDRPPDLLVRPRKGEGRLIQLRVEENPWWWLYRYGPVTGLGVVAVILLAGGYGMVRWYRIFQVRKAVRERIVDRSDDEWLIIHPVEGLKNVSDGASALLKIDSSAFNVDTLRRDHPKLSDELDRLTLNGVAPKPTTLTADGRSISVTFTPLEVFHRGRPYWLVRLRAESPTSAEARTAGLMAQRVAHDLKNPLTSILLSLQRMQMAYREENGELADTLDEYTEQIEERIASLRRMTTNVLKFVGKEDLRRTRTNLNSFLEDLCETFDHNLPPDIELRADFDRSIPSMSIDRDQMRSVIENLVTNAVEAMPDGGRLTVSTHLARDLCFDGDRARDYAVIALQDTGVGMTTFERERLFEAGFSTRDDTGIGMALVQKVVENHDGEIEVESEPDIGTSITLYFPVVATDEEDAPSSQ